MLATLAAEGVATPGGFVLPSSAFWDSLGRCGVAERARYLPEAALRLDPEHVLGIAATIAAALAASPLEEVAAPLAAAVFEQFEAPKLVCRSSAAMEDGRAAAFPGMFLSVLDIVSPCTLAAAIAACWRSVFQPTLLRYLMQVRPSRIDFSLAVLVQPQVEAAWYGVCFSRDPIDPAGAAAAELSDAAPDALVGGAPPRLRFRWRDGGWRGEGDVPAGLDRVAALATRLERRQGGPVDIEFALPRGIGEPILLQCRPITARTKRSALPDPGPAIDRFDGTPAAPGRVAGWARQGDVALVQRVTTEDYGVVLASRAIVAAAQTSPLSHAAILCRELGVPLVAGVGAAIDRLGGRHLVVDGDDGVVAVLAGADVMGEMDAALPEEDDAVLSVTELRLRLLAFTEPGDDPDAARNDILARYRRSLGAARYRIVAECRLD